MPRPSAANSIASAHRRPRAGIKGSMSLVIRSGKHVYQVNALQLTALSIKSNHATLNGLAQVTGISVTKSPVLVDSNATFQLQFSDNGNPGTMDTLAATVWNGRGGLWFSSNWDGTKTLEQALGGGNFVIVAPAGSTLVIEAHTEPFSL